MKVTRIEFKSEFGNIGFLLKLHKVDLYCAHRSAVEAEGIESICAFADPKNRVIILIEEDCDQLSNDSIRAIICHELAHIIDPTISEEGADYFAACNTSRQAVHKAVCETENVRNRIRTVRDGMYTPMAVEF